MFTDVAEKHVTSIFTVEEYRRLTLKMEATYFSETSENINCA
jgi:hypothetical protein